MLAEISNIYSCFIYLWVLIAEWELKYLERMELNEYNKTKCTDALSKSLSKTLKNEKLQGIANVDVNDVSVKSRTLEIKFTVSYIFCIPTVEVFSEVVSKCFEKNNLTYISIKNGKEVSR